MKRSEYTADPFYPFTYIMDVFEKDGVQQDKAISETETCLTDIRFAMLISGGHILSKPKEKLAMTCIVAREYECNCCNKPFERKEISSTNAFGG